MLIPWLKLGTWYVMRLGNIYETVLLLQEDAIKRSSNGWLLATRPFPSRETADEYRLRWEAAGGPPQWK